MTTIEKPNGEFHGEGLTLTWNADAGIWMLRVAGSLRLGDGKAKFDSIVETIREDAGKAIIDLAALRRVDSAGLGALTLAASRLGQRGRFVTINERLESLLVVCKLLTALPISETEDAALRELAAVP